MTRTTIALAAAVSVIVGGPAWADPTPPTLTASIGDVRLFGTAVVSGQLQPPHPGEAVRVELLLDGKPVGSADVTPADGSTFSAGFDVERPGTYSGRVTFDGAQHDPIQAVTETRKVAFPNKLRPGSKGPTVRALEERLTDLGYYLRRPNERLDRWTADAVLAFHKVQGMRRGTTVRRATWRRLMDPRTPRPKTKQPSSHIEVDQGRQVLYVVRDGEIDEIVHVSTGAGGATRDGTFRVHRKLEGYSPNRLFYPSYFDGLRAVHGWPDVPVTPASHGCVRVSMWAAKHMYQVMRYGMVVRVYH
ncbi:MAG TPA: L,D-transpeptidase family protein [Actinomycetota bacterium]|nr:L,D-transpeptidase family protein [Actinomycetota bacterium]